MDFQNKVVLVTGGSSGIGADAAIEFAKQGAKLALVGRHENRLNAVVEGIKSNGYSPPLAIVADVSTEATKIIDETIKHFNQLDILVNNAGIGIFDTAPTIELSEFDRIFSVNVRSIVELTKLATPHLEKTKGNVVNVSSIAGIKPMDNFISLCMTKAALDMYTKCASLELATKGIRVNSVNPGVVRTSALKPLGFDDKEIESFYKSHAKSYPVGRVGEVADTTNAILFLANEKSSFINGALLVLDGGRVLA